MSFELMCVLYCRAFLLPQKDLSLVASPPPTLAPGIFLSLLIFVFWMFHLNGIIMCGVLHQTHFVSKMFWQLLSIVALINSSLLF
jgi:hypothetical protein